MHVADASVLKMSSELPNQEVSFADGTHEEDQLAKMALLTEGASIADFPSEQPARAPVELPVLPDSEQNERHLASEPTDEPPPIPCTKCLDPGGNFPYKMTTLRSGKPTNLYRGGPFDLQVCASIG